MVRIRPLLAGLAGAALAAILVEVGLALASDRSLTGWQMTSIAVGGPAAGLGLLVVWHRPANRIGWVFIAAGTGFALDLVALGMLGSGAGTGPAWHLAVAAGYLRISAGPLSAIWMLLILLFPDGRFSGSAWRRLAIAAGGVLLTASTVTFLVAPHGYLPMQYGVTASAIPSGPLPFGSASPWLDLVQLPNVVLPALAVVALLDRYRLAASGVRQQIKWLMLAVAVSVSVQAASVPLAGAGIGWPPFLTLLVAPLPTIGAGIAIFRYRLWDIDRLMTRTMAFAGLWLVAMALLLGVAVLAGTEVGSRNGPLVEAVLLALLVAVVLQPLRSRLEAAITRLVYGAHPGGFTAVRALTDALRGRADSRRVPDLVVEAARDGLGTPWAGLWLVVDLDGRRALRLAAVTGADEAVESLEASPVLITSREAEPDLEHHLASLGRPAAAVVALRAGAEELGLLALGTDPDRAIGDEERQLLAVIASQSSLSLRNARLEEELRHNLAELRASRQRLVSAEDEERRRLERDLHDGVQQQLVTLAVTARRLASGRGSRQALEELASHAEEAVFSLQDLARGIYPGVLADQGLAAALRGLISRIPLHARVEVEPNLIGRRHDPDVEAGLYFLALEAVTNCQKHAPEADVTVALRSESGGRQLVLEVHDDGPGFDLGADSTGSGLQNMRDRVSALGGRFVLDSRPGAGTWIRAAVPMGAEVIALQERAVGLPDAVSRR